MCVLTYLSFRQGITLPPSPSPTVNRTPKKPIQIWVKRAWDNNMRPILNFILTLFGFIVEEKNNKFSLTKQCSSIFAFMDDLIALIISITMPQYIPLYTGRKSTVITFLEALHQTPYERPYNFTTWILNTNLLLLDCDLHLAIPTRKKCKND